MMNLKMTFLFLSISLTISGQINENSSWMDFIHELADSETDNSLIETLTEELSYLADNPFNLNTTTKKQLEQLPFLSAIQIENLLYYLYKYGEMQSVYELKNVEGMDIQTITYLLPFIYVSHEEKQENINPKHVIKYGKQEFLLRSDYCFQKKAGYRIPSEEELAKNPNKHYLGENYYLSAKYGFTYKDKIQFGITGEKDAGEAFWNDSHKGFDFYSAHFVLKKTGIIKALYFGDYKASFGEGLVLNTDFITGKTSGITNVNKSNQGIKRHFSTNEIDYFRGIALALESGNYNFNILYSCKNSDATVNDSEIISLKTDGYNRTEKDLEKKNRAELNLYGGNFVWNNGIFNFGTTAVYYDFGGKKLSPEIKPYNLFYLRGENNFNGSINYGFRQKKYTFQGETAISENNAWATINNFQYNPASFVAIVLSYRNFRKDYQSHYARSFGESSSVQNESGIYSGIRLKIIKNLEISTFIDSFKFPWLKYGIDMPSEGYDFFLQLNYRPVHNLTMNFRYREKTKSKNHTFEKATMTSIVPYNQDKFRYQAVYQSSVIKSVFQVDYTQYAESNLSGSRGWMISQTTGYFSKKTPIQIDLGCMYFNISDWNSRLYAYEKNILYAFSFPVFYGEGLRTYSVLKINFTKNLYLQTKLALTHYFDRNTIGSDLEMIEGKNKSDINFLMRVKF